MNDLDSHVKVFEGIEPFSGTVAAGFFADCSGQLTEAEFRTLWLHLENDSWKGERHVDTVFPGLHWGEGWFEIMNWVAAAREARGKYTMMTLGACYGAQAVGAYLMLQKINPMPAHLVAVEAIAQNVEWIKRHFRNNGIDPDDQWIVEAALGSDNQPTIFPVGGPGIGNQSSRGFNSPDGREGIVKEMAASNFEATAFGNLIRTNGTGIQLDLVPDTEHDVKAELRFVSTLTLADVLAPYERVDFVEVDMQASEVEVFPPAMDRLTKKVRRVHMGTHGQVIHDHMEDMFRSHGWDIVFSYAPQSEFETPHGNWTTDDGVLTAVNPTVAY